MSPSDPPPSTPPSLLTTPGGGSSASRRSEAEGSTARGGVPPLADRLSGTVHHVAPSIDESRAAPGELFLADASRLLVDSLDRDVILQRIADLAVPGLADLCVIDLSVDPDAMQWPPGVRRVTVATSPREIMPLRESGDPGDRDWDSPIGVPHVLRTGESSLVAELTDAWLEHAPLSADEVSLFRRLGIGSTITVALIARGRRLGVIQLGLTTAHRAYDATDLAVAEDLARRAAVALDNARLFEAERAARLASERAARRLQRLQAVTAALAHALTPAQVARVTLDQGFIALGAKSAALALINEDHSHLDLVRAVGYVESVAQPLRSIPLESAFPLADAARGGVPVILADVATRDARYPNLAGLRRANASGATVALPLMVDGRPVGALGFNFPETVPLTADDHAFLVALANQCAQALERARLYEAELKAREAVAIARSREALVLETISDAFVSLDRRWRCTYVNRVAAQLTGRSPESLIGRVIWDLFPEQSGEPLVPHLREAMERREARQGEGESTILDKWFEYRIYPSDEGLSVFFRDVTERRRAEERKEFLGEASRLLAASLDYATTLQTVAQIVVPTLADSCIIDLSTPEGTLERVATVFKSEDMGRKVRDLRRDHPLDPAAGHPAYGVLATGETIFYPRLTKDALRLITDDRPESLQLVKDFAPTSCVFVALKSRARTFGVMSLATTRSRRPFTERERLLIEELAERVAIAVDNARLHDAERIAREEAEAANQAKSDFLAIMSHELRTPLTAVVGYTELLADEVVGPINDTQRDHLGRVRASSEHLLLLIEDILSFSRIEAGHETPRLEDCRVLGLLEQVDSIVRPLAEKKALAFIVDRPERDALMHSDAQKVRQILINLLANAIKFTEAGEVRLLVRVLPGEFRADVIDTGPGIPARHLDRVFDAFWQVDQRMTRRTGGAGLGLSVARQLARLLGGDVTVVSEEGKGSTFTALLPLIAPPPPAPAS